MYVYYSSFTYIHRHTFVNKIPAIFASINQRNAFTAYADWMLKTVNKRHGRCVSALMHEPPTLRRRECKRLQLGGMETGNNHCGLYGEQNEFVEGMKKGLWWTCFAGGSVTWSHWRATLPENYLPVLRAVAVVVAGSISLRTTFARAIMPTTIIKITTTATAMAISINKWCNEKIAAINK